jgi:hypothetical protein
MSSGNQPLRANYGNFNLNHTILIQGRTHERWEGWFAKVLLQITPPTSSKRFVGSTSCDSDWSLHSFHGEIGFHLICCLTSNIHLFSRYQNQVGIYQFQFLLSFTHLSVFVSIKIKPSLTFQYFNLSISYTITKKKHHLYISMILTIAAEVIHR